MKRVVRHTVTQAFLNGRGKWVTGFHFAHDFKNAMAAVLACQDHRILHAELVLVMGNNRLSAEYDVVFPIFAGRSRSAAAEVRTLKGGALPAPKHHSIYPGLAATVLVDVSAQILENRLRIPRTLSIIQANQNSAARTDALIKELRAEAAKEWCS